MFTIPNLELKTRTFKQDEEMAVELRLIKNSDTLPAINPSRARAGHPRGRPRNDGICMTIYTPSKHEYIKTTTDTTSMR